MATRDVVALAGVGGNVEDIESLGIVRALFNTLNITYAGDPLFPGVDEKEAIAKRPDALKQAFLAGQKLVEDHLTE